ncbi:pyruvate dehydrogenase E2 / dihydrolipoamide acetyltransferase [Thermoplasma volcanium GSS1]|uniref:dihydrolipoyllysine-residue (2-methylpropanoyl)transferase n=1 Tax=Thermoplasma volcanium (strain ATCC 51530 / DSM 4299 / JCM 9571 / NBRC 15438 / GSS1) TaxID=273116 RepID=Q97CK2_THEVO|nr:dihydrolipoamide acetyltransferase family protein [Thermoplasma volcanium]BAB59241.1 pyruvate dehydrogenase E2 / dihydrolipoamide acetyltransferase [Thermoplasma volcanium GSS1]
MYEFKLPDIGEGVTEGEIVKWDVAEGDEVKKDQDLVEVMTDKVTVKIPSPVNGKISKILYKEGQVVPVGSTLVQIDTGEETSQQTMAEEHAELKPQTTAAQQIAIETVPAGKVLASPAVRRIARENGIDLAKVKGTGDNGRVTLDDLDAYMRGETKAKAPEKPIEAAKPAEVPPVQRSPGREEILEMHGLRRIIFDKMTKAKQIMPHFTVVEKVDVTGMISIIESAKSSGKKVTITGYIARIVPIVLKQYPYLNAIYDEANRRYLIKKYYNIGIAVDTPDGLNVFVVKDADRKSMYEITAEITDKAERARNNQLKIDEVQDSTFTITNVGTIGGVLSTPIINYPEVAILGVHRVMDENGKKIMYLSLSCDHRLIDGAVATRFIMDLKKIIEDPNSLIYEM